MGYYSDIAIQVYPKAYEELKQVWEVHNFPPYYIYRNPNSPSVIALWQCVKWYEGYDDEVDAIMDVVKRLRDYDDEDHAMCFLRVGEECGDVEEIANSKGEELCWDCYPHTSIVVEPFFKREKYSKEEK